MIQALEELALKTGAAVLKLYESRQFTIQEKSDHSPLTEADLLADRMIKEGLARILPLPLVSEETATDSVSAVLEEPRRYWLIDPIDGTKEFIARRPTFTVNIALIEDGAAVMGVVYAPSLGELYSGSAEHGLRFNGSCLVDLQWPQERTMVCSLSHADAELEAFVLREEIQHKISIGSSYKFCLLARGSAHCYPRFRSLSAWDIAGGHALIRAAGCELLEMGSNRPLRYSFNQIAMPPFYVLAPGFKLKYPLAAGA